MNRKPVEFGIGRSSVLLTCLSCCCPACLLTIEAKVVLHQVHFCEREMGLFYLSNCRSSCTFITVKCLKGVTYFTCGKMLTGRLCLSAVFKWLSWSKVPVKPRRSLKQHCNFSIHSPAVTSLAVKLWFELSSWVYLPHRHVLVFCVSTTAN